MRSFLFGQIRFPTVREIGKAVGLSFTATVHAYLDRLERKKFLRRGSFVYPGQ
ncbi:MAG: hypothetical protein ACUVSK_08430 [Desulfotomaculales bacterium]